MRVLLVGPDFEANLSLLFLASSLRASGHEPVIAPFNCWEDAPSVLQAARGADLVGLSMCFQIRTVEFLALADGLKQLAPGRPVIAGGHHASCAASELIEHHPALDAIVLHEGEDTLVELANLGAELVARAGEVPGVVVRRSGRALFSPRRPVRENLDALPRPDRSGPARLLCGVPTAYLMGSRGCVSDCDYCCITTLHRLAAGPRFRQRSPEDVAGEMADLYHQRGVRQFVFHDDNFLVPNQEHNRARIGAMDAVLKARGVRDAGLVLKCSPRDADRGVLETLRGMGLLRIFMGIESASSCGLASIGRRQTVEQNECALATTEALGISAQYTLIIFHPEATLASMLADLEFAARHPAHPLNYCRAEVYSGTPLEARMVAAGRAEGSYLGRTYRYTDPEVSTVWETGKDLFAGRCWGKDDLLGKVIRIDHQVAVLGRFYEGRKVRELVRSFLDWQVDLNLETAGFFRELVVACDGARGPGDPALQRVVDSIARRELPAREERLRRLCDFRVALDRFANASVSSGRRIAVAPPASRLRMPRHAAAVAAAIGLFGCAVAHDRGIMEAPPPPIDPRPPPVPPPPPETQQQKPTEPPPPQSPWVPVPDPVPPDHIRDEGVAEAAPPPYDELVPPPYLFDHGVAEAAPPPHDPVRVKPPPPPPPPPPIDELKKFRHDHGVAEAAPPPYDKRRGPVDPLEDVPPPVKPPPFLHDHGVAEAAPPPYDRYRHDGGVAEAAPPPYDKQRLHEVPAPMHAELRTTPAVRLTVAGRPSSTQLRIEANGAPVTIGVPGAPISARLRLTARRNGGPTARIDSAAPLVVRYQGNTGKTPWTSSLPYVPGTHSITLENPATGDKLVVHLTLAN